MKLDSFYLWQCMSSSNTMPETILQKKDLETFVNILGKNARLCRRCGCCVTDLSHNMHGEIVYKKLDFVPKNTLLNSGKVIKPLVARNWHTSRQMFALSAFSVAHPIRVGDLFYNAAFSTVRSELNSFNLLCSPHIILRN